MFGQWQSAFACHFYFRSFSKINQASMDRRHVSVELERKATVLFVRPMLVYISYWCLVGWLSLLPIPFAAQVDFGVQVGSCLSGCTAALHRMHHLLITYSLALSLSCSLKRLDLRWLCYGKSPTTSVYIPVLASLTQTASLWYSFAGLDSTPIH